MTCPNNFPHCPRCDSCMGELDEEVTVALCVCEAFAYLPGLEGWFVSYAHIQAEAEKIERANPELKEEFLKVKRQIEN